MKKLCKYCKKEKDLIEFGKNKKYSDGLWIYCKICSREKAKISRSNPDVRKRGNQRTSEYYQKNKQRRNEYQKQKYHERMKSDPLFVLKRRYRLRTSKIFRYKSFEKLGSSLKLLGCSSEEFKIYFESKFTEGMSWDKVFSGDIHIDHIIPISSAKTIEELEALSHYTNLQPLWKSDNLKKSDTLALT